MLRATLFWKRLHRSSSDLDSSGPGQSALLSLSVRPRDSGTGPQLTLAGRREPIAHPQQPCYPDQNLSTDLTICSVIGKWDERKSKVALTECKLLISPLVIGFFLLTELQSMFLVILVTFAKLPLRYPSHILQEPHLREKCALIVIKKMGS